MAYRSTHAARDVTHDGFSCRREPFVHDDFTYRHFSQRIITAFDARAAARFYEFYYMLPRRRLLFPRRRAFIMMI